MTADTAGRTRYCIAFSVPVIRKTLSCTEGGDFMAYDLDNRLVIGVSTRALFNLGLENEIFEKEGVESYREYQTEHEADILQPGPGFPLVKALLAINTLPGQEGRVEVIVMSRNSADTSLRVFHSIEYYGLDITRAVLAGGASLAPYLEAFRTDLFLSACEDDVQRAVDSGIAAGIICDGIREYTREENIRQIRIAFDGDAVFLRMNRNAFSGSRGLPHLKKTNGASPTVPWRKGLLHASSKPLPYCSRSSAGSDAYQDGSCHLQECACP